MILWENTVFGSDRRALFIFLFFFFLSLSAMIITEDESRWTVRRVVFGVNRGIPSSSFELPSSSFERNVLHESVIHYDRIVRTIVQIITVMTRGNDR